MNTTRQSRQIKFQGMAPGFTLIELLVVMFIASVAMAAIYRVAISVSESYGVQRELADMQQNLRSAMYLIKNDLRNTSRNPNRTEEYGITNVSRLNPDDNDPDGYPGITMTTMFDQDRDGQADIGSERTITYQINDADGDGRRELWRMVQDTFNSTDEIWHLVCDGIDDISFAFAIDEDNDLDLDRSVGAATVIWAINTDSDLGLDTNADNVPDGDINALDDGDEDGDIDSADGGLGTQIPLSAIRVVRIWLLARSRQAYRQFEDNSTYVLGHKVIDMSLEDNADRRKFRHKMLVGAVAIQNHYRAP
jgi:type II secretion system protein J